MEDSVVNADEFAAAYDEVSNSRSGDSNTETPNETPSESPVKEDTGDVKKEDPKPKDDDKPKSEGKVKEDDKHRQNSRNAQRRINAKKAREARMERIRKEHEGLSNSEIKDDPAVQMRLRNLEDRYGDLEAESNDEKYNQFSDSVYEAYGDDYDKAEKALDAIDRCADYVNKNEPMLRKIAQRPNGMKVLGEWSVMMGNEKNRKEWFNLLPSEKETIIRNMYAKLCTVPQQSVSTAVPPEPKVTNAPIANSGKQQGLIDGDTDDFAVAYQQVFNQRLDKYR